MEQKLQDIQGVITDAGQHYNNVSIFLHWLIAGLIFVMYPLGWYMSDLPEGHLKHILYSTHKSIGMTIFLVLLVRIAWRLTHPKPRLPETMPLWQRQLANYVQAMLYVLLVIQPLTGYLSTSFSGYKTNFWGLPLPYWGWKVPALNQFFTDLHTANSVALFALIILHICGAFAHLVSKHENVLPRMLPARFTRGRGAGGL